MNQKGNSIIGVLVAFGLMAILLRSVLSLLNVGQKVQSGFASEIYFQQLLHTSTFSLMNPQICDQVFQGKVIVASLENEISIAAFTTITYNAVEIVSTANTKELKNIVFRAEHGVAGAPGATGQQNYAVDIVVRADRANNGVGISNFRGMFTLQFVVNITDPSNLIIVSCIPVQVAFSEPRDRKTRDVVM
jgi:hypothetical protein